MTLKITDVRTHDALLRDVYPVPGERIKQWVVDARKEREWVQKTCPTIDVPMHLDNTDVPCSSWRATRWIDLFDHHCCSLCGDLAERTKAGIGVEAYGVTAWLKLRDERPKPTEDREALSDEIAPDLSMRDNPLFKLLRKP